MFYNSQLINVQIEFFSQLIALIRGRLSKYNSVYSQLGVNFVEVSQTTRANTVVYTGCTSSGLRINE